MTSGVSVDDVRSFLEGNGIDAVHFDDCEWCRTEDHEVVSVTEEGIILSRYISGYDRIRHDIEGYCWFEINEQECYYSLFLKKDKELTKEEFEGKYGANG